MSELQIIEVALRQAARRRRWARALRGLWRGLLAGALLSLVVIGLWHLLPLPLWTLSAAALAPFAGMGTPATVERMKGIPQFVVHGDADMTVPVAGSRLRVEAMKKLGIDHQYVEVPGGDHSNVVAPKIPAMFEFFNKHRKGAPSGRQPK